MINRLCKRLNQNIEVRQSLSSLRQEIKDSSKRELLLSWIHDGDLDLSVFLENEDAKTRKNAALLTVIWHLFLKVMLYFMLISQKIHVL